MEKNPVIKWVKETQEQCESITWNPIPIHGRIAHCKKTGENCLYKKCPKVESDISTIE